MKRETFQKIRLYHHSSYFNPLPREEGDSLGQGMSGNDSYFNPLPREEGDLLPHLKTGQKQTISIHSLVKRETGRARYTASQARHFNPLPREEGDSRSMMSLSYSLYFNPLPREEGDKFFIELRTIP